MTFIVSLYNLFHNIKEMKNKFINLYSKIIKKQIFILKRLLINYNLIYCFLNNILKFYVKKIFN